MQQIQMAVSDSEKTSALAGGVTIFRKGLLGSFVFFFCFVLSWSLLNFVIIRRLVVAAAEEGSAENTGASRRFRRWR